MAEEKAAKKRTQLTDLDEDALVQCASYLRAEDVGSLSATCKYLNRVYYSDSIWIPRYCEYWRWAPDSGAREAFYSRQAAMRKFGFSKPWSVVHEFKPCADGQGKLCLLSGIIIGWNDVIVTAMIDPPIPDYGVDAFVYGMEFQSRVRGHSEKITCMRLFPLGKEKLLVTSSFDHSIRLFRKGSRQQYFRGHTGPVLTLSDELLGDDSTKLLASGGNDGTVRLWSVGKPKKCAKLHGHEKPVKFVSVSRHRPPHLASISTDSKVRVWDAAASSSSRSTCCVGTTSVSGVPVNLKCHESLLYIASSNSVTAIDMRTMQKAFVLQDGQTKMCAFEMMPSKYSICTGSNCKALLWDIRQTQNTRKPKLVAELDGHKGQVTLLHMDYYKVVTSCLEDVNVHVWNADTGTQMNSMVRHVRGSIGRYTAMAAYGARMVTLFNVNEDSYSEVHYRDFMNSPRASALTQ